MLLADLLVNPPLGLEVLATECEGGYGRRNEAAGLVAHLHIDDHECRGTELGIHHAHQHHNMDLVRQCGAHLIVAAASPPDHARSPARTSAIRPTPQLGRPVGADGSMHSPRAATRSISGDSERPKNTSSISRLAR